VIPKSCVRGGRVESETSLVQGKVEQIGSLLAKGDHPR
jgi:hypothetical protein